MLFLYDAFLRAPAVSTDAEPNDTVRSLPVAGGPDSSEALFSSFWPQSYGHREFPPMSGNSLPVGGNDLPTRDFPAADTAAAGQQSSQSGPRLPVSLTREDGEVLRAAGHSGVSGAPQLPAPEPQPSELSVSVPSRYLPPPPELAARRIETPATLAAAHEAPARPPAKHFSSATPVIQPAVAGGSQEAPADYGHQPRVLEPANPGAVPLTGGDNIASRRERPAAEFTVRPGKPVPVFGSDAAARNSGEKMVLPADHDDSGLESPVRPAGVKYAADVERPVSRQLVSRELAASAVSAEKEAADSLPTARMRPGPLHLLDNKTYIEQDIKTINQKLDKVLPPTNHAPGGASAVRKLSPDHHPQRVVSHPASAHNRDRLRLILPASAAVGDRPGAERIASATAPEPGPAPAPERPTDLGPLSRPALPAKPDVAAGENQEAVRQVTAKTPVTVVAQAAAGDNAAAVPAPLEPVSAVRAQPALLATPISQDLADERWGQAVGERLLVMVDKLIGKAQIRLNPAHLGPVKVEIDTIRGGSSVEFVAASPVTREALESALPRLREMFEQQGLSLSEASVRDEPGRQTDARDERRDGQRTGESWSRREHADTATTRHPTSPPDTEALVDTYV